MRSSARLSSWPPIVKPICASSPAAGSAVVDELGAARPSGALRRLLAEVVAPIPGPPRARGAGAGARARRLGRRADGGLGRRRGSGSAAATLGDDGRLAGRRGVHDRRLGRRAVGSAAVSAASVGSNVRGRRPCGARSRRGACVRGGARLARGRLGAALAAAARGLRAAGLARRCARRRRPPPSRRLGGSKVRGAAALRRLAVRATCAPRRRTSRGLRPFSCRSPGESAGRDGRFPISGEALRRDAQRRARRRSDRLRRLLRGSRPSAAPRAHADDGRSPAELQARHRSPSRPAST